MYQHLISIGNVLQLLLVCFDSGWYGEMSGHPTGILGAAINGKLTEIRLKNKKVALDAALMLTTTQVR